MELYCFYVTISEDDDADALHAIAYMFEDDEDKQDDREALHAIAHMFDNDESVEMEQRRRYGYGMDDATKQAENQNDDCG